MGLFALPYREIDGRRTMRSLADALDALQKSNGLSANERVEIRTIGVTLPNRRLTGIVSVIGPQRPDGSRWVVRLPTAAKFTAATTLGEQQVYDISLLDEAVSDCIGNVELKTNQVLHRIELIPAPFHYELTPRERAIILATIVYLKKEDECYPFVDRALLPGIRMLRFDAIAGVRPTNLKVILEYVNNKLREPISLSILTKTLARAGMQLPGSNRGT